MKNETEQQKNEVVQKKSNRQQAAEPNSFGTLGETLPKETRENLERILSDSQHVLAATRNYISKPPAEAIGLLAVGAGVLWALTSTAPGRRATQAR